MDKKKKKEFYAFLDVMCEIVEWSAVFELHTTLKFALAKQQSVLNEIMVVENVHRSNGSTLQQTNSSE